LPHETPSPLNSRPSSAAPAITSTAPESCLLPGRSPWSIASTSAKAIEVLRSVMTAPAPTRESDSSISAKDSVQIPPVASIRHGLRRAC
jgi:hypothetical protein